MPTRFAAGALIVFAGLTAAAPTAVADLRHAPCPIVDVLGDDGGPARERDALRTGASTACGGQASTAADTRRAGVWFGKPVSKAASRGPSVRLAADASGFVVAREGGVVTEISRDAGGLYEVFVARRGSDLSLYAGLDAVTVAIGQTVSAGQPLGRGARSPDGMIGAWFSRKLPAELFGRGIQSPDVATSRPLLTISLEGWHGRFAEVWIDGIYVGELNPTHGFALNLTGLAPGRHDVVIMAVGEGSLSNASLSIERADRVVRHRWGGGRVQKVSVSV